MLVTRRSALAAPRALQGLALCLAALFALAGGGTSETGAGAAPGAGVAAERATAGTPSEGGTLKVAAAASLRKLFESTAKEWSGAHGDCQLRFAFDASSELARQIEEGAS